MKNILTKLIESICPISTLYHCTLHCNISKHFSLQNETFFKLHDQLSPDNVCDMFVISMSVFTWR